MCVLMLDGAGSWTCLSAVLSQHPQHIQHVGHWLLGSSAADTQNKAVAAMHPFSLVQLRYRDTALHSTQKMLHIISFFSPVLCVLVTIIQVDLGRPVAATSQWHEGWALAMLERSTGLAWWNQKLCSPPQYLPLLGAITASYSVERGGGCRGGGW